MRDELILGIDLGTTNIKVAAFSPNGEMVAVGSKPTPSYSPRPGWTEHDPSEIRDSLISAVKEVVERSKDRGKIAAVAVASMGEAGVPISSDGNWCGPIIAWFDPRSEPQSRMIEELIGGFRIFEITGNSPHPMFSINKIAWLKENMPQVYSKMEKWLCMEDFVIYILSGEMVTSYSMASRTMAFDLRRKEWSREILEAVGVPHSLFPTPMPSGRPVAKILPDISRETGIDEGAWVVTGGHDHTCGSVASYAFEEGVLLDSSGTTEAMFLSIKDPLFSEELMRKGYSYECHVIGDLYVLSSFIMTSGVVLDWIKDITGYGDYEELSRDAASIEPGSNGLFLLPHFRGAGTPYGDPFSRGAIVGIGDLHRRAHLARAAMEGICYEMRANIQTIESFGFGVRLIKAIGGGARNDLWLRMKADITGKEIIVPSISESTAFGAALLAGLGIGLYKDPAEIGKIIKVRAHITPNMDMHRIYTGIYESFYLKIYDALSELNRRISSTFLSNSSTTSGG